jgi:predicted AAA+ superfamily ATPase
LFKGLKKPEKMLELLKLLAWQIGSEANYNELSKNLKLDNQTVEIKWNKSKTARLTKSFTNLYGETKFSVINQDNFFEEIEQVGLNF